jgi:hypothetical protein
MMAPIALVQSANVELESARAFDCSARTADSAPPPERAALRPRFGGGRHGGKSKIANVSTAIGNLESLVPSSAFFPMAGGGTL